LDIVGVSSLVADAQIIATMCNVMIALGIEKFKVKVGHRGLLDGLFDGMNVSAEDKMFFLRELDKVDPENPESIKDKFIEKGIKKEVVSNIFELLFGPSLKMFDISNFKGFEKKFEAKVNESQAQLQRLVANVKELGIDVDKWLSASPSIVRGLGYYTGPVWETVLLDAPEFGSVYSGGRYDDLLERFGSRKLPAVGTSIGVDRLMAALEKLGKLDELSQGSVQVVLANFGEEFIPEQLKIVAELRAAGISTELYLGKEKGLGQQIGYAEARGAKVVVLYGADEQKEGKVAIKNLATKEQVSVGRDQAVGAIGKNAVLTELV
jgi:histidyl-tRNA synthetase